MQKFGYPQTQCALNENIFFVANCRPNRLETRNEGLRHWLWYWRFGLLYGKKFWMWRYVFRLLEIWKFSHDRHLKKIKKYLSLKWKRHYLYLQSWHSPIFYDIWISRSWKKMSWKGRSLLRQSLLRYRTLQKRKIQAS